MISKLLILRIKQILRLLNQNGIAGFFLTVCVIFLAYTASLKGYSLNKYFFYFSILILILFIHLGRKDKRFLKKFKKNGFFFILIEYFIINFMIILPNIEKIAIVDIKCIVSLLIIEALIIYFLHEQLNNPIVKWIKKITNYIPLSTYELRFGIRKYFFLFTLSYSIGLLIIPFFPITPILLLYLSTFVFEFYKEKDPKEFIQSKKTVRNFLFTKLKSNIVFLNILLVPHYFLYVFFHHHYKEIGALILSILIFSVLIAYCIMLKYSTSNSKTPKAILFFVAAPLLPLSLILFIKEQKAARCQLMKLLQ